MNKTVTNTLLMLFIGIICTGQALADNKYAYLLGKKIFVREPVITCIGVDALVRYTKYGENGNVLGQSQLRRNGTCVQTARASDLVITAVGEYTPGRSDLLIIEIKYATNKSPHTNYFTLMNN
jgi:hypothetical protein